MQSVRILYDLDRLLFCFYGSELKNAALFEIMSKPSVGFGVFSLAGKSCAEARYSEDSNSSVPRYAILGFNIARLRCLFRPRSSCYILSQNTMSL